MAGKSDVKAGGAYVEIFTKGLKSTQQQLQSLGASVARVGGVIAGVGGAIVGPLAAAVQQFTSVGGAIDDMSGRTGYARTELAQLGYAAQQGGATMEDLERAIRQQQRLGIAGTFDEVAASIAAIEDPAERAKVAMETWGRSGTMLLPMIDQLQELKAEARGLGIGVNEQDIKNADALGDSFAKIQSQLGAIVFNIGAALAEPLLAASEIVSGIIRSVTRWVEQNRNLFRIIAMVGVGLVAVGSTVATIGAGLALLGVTLGGIAAAIPFLTAAFAAVMSPVGLIVAGVVAIGAAIAAAIVYWVRFTESGRKAFAGLMKAFKPFADTMATAFGGILDSLRGGSIELAFQVMVAGLKLLWAQFVQFAMGKFLELVESIAGNDFVRGALGDDLAGGIRTAARTARAEQSMAVRALQMQLEELRKKAADAVPKPAPGRAGGGLLPDLEALGDDATRERASITAGTTAQALALTFGQRKPGDLTKAMLEELRMARKISIKFHEALLREFRGFGRVGA